MFWEFLRHPEVHILILPAFGLISEMISKFSQCIISGRDSMLIALLIIAVLGCIVRGHHMFMVGFDLDTRSYFTFPTSIIAIPTGIKILNRLATIWTSCFSLITPLYFIIGFPFSSSFGGFWGISIGFMSSIIKFLLLLYPLVQHVLYDYGFIRYLVFDDILVVLP